MCSLWTRKRALVRDARLNTGAPRKTSEEFVELDPAKQVLTVNYGKLYAASAINGSDYDTYVTIERSFNAFLIFQLKHTATEYFTFKNVIFLSNSLNYRAPGTM